jgi:hypothetical protein
VWRMHGVGLPCRCLLTHVAQNHESANPMVM